MDGGKVEWRAGGHLCICGNGGTENVRLEKRKRRIKEGMASENVARKVIVSLTYPIIIMQPCFLEVV